MPKLTNNGIEVATRRRAIVQSGVSKTGPTRITAKIIRPNSGMKLRKKLRNAIGKAKGTCKIVSAIKTRIAVVKAIKDFLKIYSSIH